MPRIKCHYTDCVFLDEGLCGAAAVEIDPDTGCVTHSPAEGTSEEDEWEDEEEAEEWEDEEDGEDDDWLEEEDGF